MPVCDISGKQVPRTVKVSIEGVVMQVAPEHVGLGVPLESSVGNGTKSAARSVFKRPVRSRNTEPELVLVDDFSKRVSRARQTRGLKQEELAKLMQERVSVVQHVENGQLHPSEVLAAKFKRHLGIELYEKVAAFEEDSLDDDVDVGAPATLGDIFLEALKKGKK